MLMGPIKLNIAHPSSQASYALRNEDVSANHELHVEVECIFIFIITITTNLVYSTQGLGAQRGGEKRGGGRTWSFTIQSRMHNNPLRVSLHLLLSTSNEIPSNRFRRPSP